MESPTPQIPAAGSTALARPCVKCRAQEATLDSRSQPVCRACFLKFISLKCIKQIGILGKQTPTSHHSAPPTRHYILGLSLGVSSTVLLHLLHENVQFQLAKGRPPPFTLTVIYVDSSCLSPPSTSPSPDPLEKYRAAYPNSPFTFLTLPLSTALTCEGIDFSSLPALDETLPEEERLRKFFFDGLPSAASRKDIQRLFTRHILLSKARNRGANALLLGSSTTALAEVTLSEAAKGRGFAVPWVVSDGPTAYPSSGEAQGKDILIYHPLRDALRKELHTYSQLTEPPLTDLISTEGEMSREGAVVSHKDLSIEEVMFRYFAEVEERYPAVVANVARTTGKLVRLEDTEGEERKGCGMCGVPLDGEGDERWRGEIGEEEEEGKRGRGGLCYGCERSLRS